MRWIHFWRWLNGKPMNFIWAWWPNVCELEKGDLDIEDIKYLRDLAFDKPNDLISTIEGYEDWMRNDYDLHTLNTAFMSLWQDMIADHESISTLNHSYRYGTNQIYMPREKKLQTACFMAAQRMKCIIRQMDQRIMIINSNRKN